MAADTILYHHFQEHLETGETALHLASKGVRRLENDSQRERHHQNARGVSKCQEEVKTG